MPIVLMHTLKDMYVTLWLDNGESFFTGLIGLDFPLILETYPSVLEGCEFLRNFFLKN